MRVLFAILLRLEFRAKFARSHQRFVQRADIDGRVLELVGKLDRRFQLQAHGAHEIESGAAAIVLRDHQALAIVRELHFGAHDFDSGAGSRVFLRLRQLQQSLRKIDIGLRGFERGRGAKGGEIRARDLIGDLIPWSRRNRA